MLKQISFNYENQFIKNSSDIVIGIDEAGRGCLAGSVVAACVWINQSKFPKQLLEQINDSKKLSESKRLFIFNELMNLPTDTFIYTYHDIDAEIIDKINILQATFKAMSEAYRKITKLLTTFPVKVLIDGNQKPKDIPNSFNIIKGDSLSYSIATASIIAKVQKDKLLNEIGNLYPQYAFNKNKCYGTKSHLSLLQKYVVSPLHRKSYKQIKYILNHFVES